MGTRVIELQQMEEAFSHLSPEVQGHCQRVSRYAEVLFTQIVAEDVYGDTFTAGRYLQAENKDFVGEAALYHDIGKAYVPPLYQQYSPNFTEEELAVYRKHVSDGEELLPTLMPGFKKRPANERNIFLETIRDHHEHFDGSGYPLGKADKDISYVGRILCIVNDFDSLSMSIVSEDPVEEAVEKMKPHTGTKYDPEFFKMLLMCKGKLKKLFMANSVGSQAIPATDTFVRRRNRPMELAYRPIMGTEKDFKGYDCRMLFYNGKENVWQYDEVRHIISKHALAVDMCTYFAYEACDALRRFETYGVPHTAVTLTMLPLFFSKKNNVANLLTVLEQQEMDTERLRIGVPAELFEKPTKAMALTLAECKAQGFTTVVTGLDFRMVPPSLLAEYGVTGVRLEADAGSGLELPHFAAWVKEAQNLGLTVGVNGLDKTKHIQALTAMGIKGYTGALAGDYESEKTILQREIALRQSRADGG